MSFLKNIFGSSQTEASQSKIDWHTLNDLGQLGEIVVASKTKPVLLFKHSTTCSISRMALKNFEREFDLQQQITPYFLDLLRHRDISNEIAARFEVVHQSPQILLIKDGKSIYNTSHENIDATVLREKI
jgi:bacillithiol system protein YtxJ